MSPSLASTVDVVIPTIGRQSLRRAVSSALAQSVPVSVFVVLDRPTEAEQVKKHLNQLDYQLLLTSGGIGGGAARNLGLDQGAAPYVAFLDDDDWWEPAFLTQRLETAYVDNHHGADIVFGRFVFERRDGTSSHVPSFPVPILQLADVPSYMVTRKSMRFGDQAVQTSSMLLKRSAVSTVRWDSSLRKHQDWDLVLALTSLPKTTAAWDFHASVHVQQDSPGSISKKNDWSASYSWWRSRSTSFAPRASSDFLATHVLRAALTQRSLSGCVRAISSMRRIPHLAALAVAAAGILKQ